MSALARAARALLLSAPPLFLAFANAALLRAHWDLDNIGTSRRYWEDLTVAFSQYETRNWGPTLTLPIGDALARHVNRRLRELVPRAVKRDGVRPWEFWRTVEFRGFRNIAPFELRFSDDTGRARLSAFGFTARGGIAPYLPIWLPFLAFLPVAMWVVIEGIRCREGPAVLLFLALLACSPYLLETLTLPYSAVGFHLIAGLSVVPLAFFAFGPMPTRGGVWCRVLVAAAIIHVAALCRSSAIIFLPLAAVLLLIALLRVDAGRPLRHRVVHAIAVVVALAAPRALAPDQAHERWVGMWEGLGDFDRRYGHTWSDPAARQALDREGYTMERRGPYWTPESEAIFRRLVLTNVTRDPAWYASILGRRLVATVTQWRLWPLARETGASYLPARHHAEGFVETYYNFVATADRFTLFGRSLEAPLWIFWGAAGAFLAIALRSRRQAGHQKRLGIFGAFVAAALILPVAVTTMSGIETQFIMLGYLLSAAFLLSDAVLGLRARFGGSS